MICDLASLDGDGPPLVTTGTSADLRPSLGVPFLGAGVCGCLLEACSEDGLGQLFVLELGSLGLHPDLDASGFVRELDSRVRHVTVLSTSTRSPTGFEVQVTFIQFDPGGILQVQDRHGNCGRVYPTPLLVGRDSLPPMATCLVLECPHSVPASYTEGQVTGAIFYNIESNVKGTPDSPSCGRC